MDFQVGKICKLLVDEGAPATFGALVALLDALDPTSRGNGAQDWQLVDDHVDGGIVPEFGALLLTTCACVLICTYNLGGAGAPGSTPRLAFTTALGMRGNLTAMVDQTERETDMSARLDALEKELEAGGVGAGFGKQPGEMLEALENVTITCRVGELSNAFNAFVETYF